MSDGKLPVVKSEFANPEDLHCCDCGGWPVEGGAVFVAVFLVRNKSCEIGGICELCWLIRLQNRGRIINATSSPGSQVDVPALGIHRPKPQRPFGGR